MTRLCFAVTTVVMVLTIVTKPVQLLLSYTLAVLRAMTSAVYKLFTTTTSLQHTRMFTLVLSVLN